MSDKIESIEVDYDPFSENIELSQVIPSTEAQQEIWASIQMDQQASCAFNESITLHFKGLLNTSALTESLHYIIDRHEAMRMTFTPDGSQLCIAQSLQIEIPIISGDQSTLSKHLVKEAETPFDLETGPLIRCLLIRVSNEDFHLILTAHHIVCDGWSLAIMLNDLGEAYSSFSRSQLPAQETAFSFSQFISQNKADIEGNADEAFWLEQFSSHIPSYELPIDKKRPTLRSFNSQRFDYAVNTDLISDIKKTASSNGFSLTAIMLAAYYVCLQRWSGEDSLVAGIPAASQPSYAPNTLVGHCVNLLPILITVDSEAPFSELTRQVSECILTSYEHQNYTFGTLLKKLPIPRDPSRIPLVPTLFNVDEGIQGKDLAFPDLSVDFHSNPRHFENFELFLNASDYGEKFIIECQYNSDLFTEHSIDQRLHEYTQVLKSICLAPHTPVEDIRLLGEKERANQLEQQPNTNTWPQSSGLDDTETTNLYLHSLLSAQANETPNSIAAICGIEQISYVELDQQSNQLANLLVSKGVTQGALVGLCVDRSINMLIALMGIVKSGCGYVPLDPDYPSDRLEYMIDDSGLQALITQTRYSAQLPKTETTIEIDELTTLINNESTTPPATDIHPSNTAYVIYTSGSTGRPKGVEVQHSAVVNFLGSMSKTPGLNSDDVMLAVTTLSFDIAVLELYLPLTVGAQTVIAEKSDAIDGNKLLNLIDSHNVSAMQATPATWQMLISSGWKGNNNLKALCGGEALPKDLASQLYQRSKELWNMYGPTETTVWSTCQKIIDPEQPISIGHPIANTEIYLLDKKREPVPQGIAGELYIGGKGVTKGYLNREELTKERFLDNPFTGSGYIYRTGDKVKRRSDGSLEYLGRLDSQIKLRGFRIELGEIETLIRQHPNVNDCAIAVKQHNAGDDRLIAYIIWNTAALSLSELRQYLLAWLPPYMLPQHIVALSVFPKTPNGKLDRNSLPSPEFESTQTKTFIAPKSETEAVLLKIWKDVLGIQSFSTEDNFFDLGGHSLLIARIIQKFNEEKSVLLQYSDIFNFPTVCSLAELIEGMSKRNSHLTNEIMPRTPDQATILSLAQQRLWYLDKLNPNSTHFNLPSAFRFAGGINKAALNNAFNELISRHESLRTGIIEENEVPVQKIANSIDFSLPEIDLSNLQTEERETGLTKKLDELQSTVFDITKAPLFVSALIKINDDEHVLFFMPHHLIFDGWSFDVFIHEITVLYGKHSGSTNHPLPSLPIQYADYSLWLRDLLSGTELDKQLDFWKESLQGTLPILEMPLDHPRPETAQNTGNEIHFEIEEKLLQNLQELAKNQESSLFMVMLAAYASLLHRYTGQRDLIIGTPMADRTRPGTENLIGFFVNALVLRFDINPNESFIQLLKQVRDRCLSGYANQDVPFEQLVELLNPIRDLSHAPLFQTSVTYQDVSSRETRMGDIDITQVEIPTREAPLDINIWFKRRDNSMLGAVVYNTSLFEHETITQFVSHYLALLESITRSWHQSVSQLPILSIEENNNQLTLHNDTDTQWDEDLKFHEIIDAQAKKTPTAIAAHCVESSLTYTELESRSNQFANLLISKGAKENTLVGLCVDRSIEMIVALLGILKSGCAYVPLDPDYPQDRLHYMIDDSKLDYLITQEKHVDKLTTVKSTLLIDQLEPTLNNQPTTLPPLEITGNTIAYVIYTSGSTGKPKGVMVHHEAAANFLQSMSNAPGLSDHDRLLAVTTLSFDIAVLELYLPLMVGAQLIIATKDEAVDGRRLLSLINKHGISAMQATPATWRLLIASGWNKETPLKVLCGGEALPKDLAEELIKRSSELWNMYGPTETTVWSSCQRVTDHRQPAKLGIPIANTQLYILDNHLQHVPHGVIGELYIGGLGVSKGYLDRPELTAERFIDNPFSNSGKLYRTGDKARYCRDNSLEYMGRIDNQIKIRGYRIELGEIETAIRLHEQVVDCALAVKEELAGDARLIAYIVWKEKALTSTELRSYLRSWMPAYMIPQHIVDISELPRTPNGKLDRSGLPDTFTQKTNISNHIEPASAEERWLADIWKDIIGISKVGLYDNFFELGGHSLLSMQVIYRVADKTGITLNPRDLLLDTLEQIAKKFSVSNEESIDSTTNEEEAQTNPEKTKKKGIKTLFNRMFK